jgi:phage shock protein PspC (stress-responsive transcriptional regulator)
MNETNTPPVKQLRRTRDGRIIAGVCSGVGDYIGIDPNILRIGLAIASFFGGLGIGVYAVAWLLVPDEGKQTSIVQDLLNRHGGSDSRLPTDWEQPPVSQQAPASYRPTDDQPPASA